MSEAWYALRYKNLFAGREDAHGTEVGGAVRALPPYSDHLRGTHEPIGVYPVVQNAVKWGCVDLDVRTDKKTGDYASEHEAHLAALNLRNALSIIGVPSYIERTRSRGRHVWVFVGAWVSAQSMRRALLSACDIADVPPREVNPKSERLEAHVLGNYVRLPYPRWLERGYDPIDTRVMIDDDELTISMWAFIDGLKFAQPARITELAQLYIPPAPRVKIVHEIRRHDGQLNPIMRRLNGLGYTVFNEGPLDGDRSRALWVLARSCQESDLTPSEALTILADADARWGKMHKRADGERQLIRIIERAY